MKKSNAVLKRYKLKQISKTKPQIEGSLGGIHMVEDTEGEWVKWEDISKIVTKTAERFIELCEEEYV